MSYKKRLNGKNKQRKRRPYVITINSGAYIEQKVFIYSSRANMPDINKLDYSSYLKNLPSMLEILRIFDCYICCTSQSA